MTNLREQEILKAVKKVQNKISLENYSIRSKFSKSRSMEWLEWIIKHTHLESNDDWFSFKNKIHIKIKRVLIQHILMVKYTNTLPVTTFSHKKHLSQRWLIPLSSLKNYTYAPLVCRCIRKSTRYLYIDSFSVFVAFIFSILIFFD